MDPQFWVAVFKIVIIDLALAGDNALVIAFAVRTLPPRQQVLGRIWGTAGAVGLRLLFIAIATVLLKIPYLQAVGGLLLIWVAFKLVLQSEGEGKVRQGTSLMEAIWIIVIADVVMSLDNVIAVAGAAEGNLVLVVCGIGLSIPIVIWGSGILARRTLMERFGAASAPLQWGVRVGLGGLVMVVGWLAMRRRAAQHEPA